MNMPSAGYLSLLLMALLGVFLLPVFAGLIGVFLPAFNYMPALGFDSPGLAPWQTLLATPGLVDMLLLSISTSVLSTLLSLLLAFGVVCHFWGTPLWFRVQRWLSPLMAVPHVALAFGIAFVLMPSGLMARVLAVFLDWNSPPGWSFVQDPYGISLILLLVVKETPFLLFMMTAAMTQLAVSPTLKLGCSLGFQPGMVWLKLIWPQLYPMIRLPVFTVLAFALSVVDVALVIGPVHPPTLAVQIFWWIQDADLNTVLLAASGSVLLLVLVVLVIGVFYLLELTSSRYLRHWLTNGHRGRFSSIWSFIAGKVWQAMLLLFCLGLCALVVWSMVWRWRFPSLWPTWSLRSWERASSALAEPVFNTLVVAVTTTIAANVIAVVMLELNQSVEQHKILNGGWSNLWNKGLRTITRGVMYVPLLLPQMTFLFGVQVLLLQWGVEGHWLTVSCLHLLFVLPYCFLSLSGPWQHYDQRQSLQGALLSGSPMRTFFQIKLGILLRPLLASVALGFTVSVAQYLSTLLASSGRVPTITTEAVGLIAGGNRRLVGVYGLVQMSLPFAAYAIAFFLSHWTIRDGRISSRFHT